MASGFGKNKIGRCYKIFSMFEECMHTEEDSSVCYDFRTQYLQCLHLPSIRMISKKQMEEMAVGKDSLFLAAKALESTGGATGSAPTKPPEESST